MTSKTNNPEGIAANVASFCDTDKAPEQMSEPVLSLDVIPTEVGETIDSAASVSIPMQPAPTSSAVLAEDNADEVSFADMLAEHERTEEPHVRLNPGQRVTVNIVAITEDTVFVSTGSKVDGIVDRADLEVDGQLPYAVGDTVDLYVVTATPQEIKLSKILRGAGNLAALEEAKEAGLPIEGKVTGTVKGGYAVDIMKRRAFCPLGQIDFRAPADPEELVGKTFAFIITKLEKGGRNIVVSRRVLLEQEQAENREALLAQIAIGDTVEAIVTRTTPFGAFAELSPGVEGLVHLSELSWTRVGQADEAVSPGDRIRAKVLAIDSGNKGTRISLSIKQVTEDPWKEIGTRLNAGDVVSGKVVRTTPFGAFIEVLPGVEGLAHISELSYERRVLKTEEVVVAGDVVTVKIKEIDLGKKRISLSLRDVAGDPWSTVADTLSEGAEILGTVANRAPFGVFFILAPGITGLLPNAVLQGSSVRKDIERLHAGDAFTVQIKSIDTQNRRISLVPVGETGSSDASGKVEEKDWKKHAAPKQPATPSIGALGMALQVAMKNKKK